MNFVPKLSRKRSKVRKPDGTDGFGAGIRSVRRSLDAELRRRVRVLMWGNQTASELEKV